MKREEGEEEQHDVMKHCCEERIWEIMVIFRKKPFVVDGEGKGRGVPPSNTNEKCIKSISHTHLDFLLFDCKRLLTRLV